RAGVGDAAAEKVDAVAARPEDRPGIADRAGEIATCDLDAVGALDQRRYTGVGDAAVRGEVDAVAARADDGAGVDDGVQAGRAVDGGPGGGDGAARGVVEIAAARQVHRAGDRHG